MVLNLFIASRPPLAELRMTWITLKHNFKFAGPIHLCNPLNVLGCVSGRPVGHNRGGRTSN